ncbi:unnamed protein product [Lota lota]
MLEPRARARLSPHMLGPETDGRQAQRMTSSVCSLHLIHASPRLTFPPLPTLPLTVLAGPSSPRVRPSAFPPVAFLMRDRKGLSVCGALSGYAADRFEGGLGGRGSFSALTGGGCGPRAP